jgi:hypothetical protein
VQSILGIFRFHWWNFRWLFLHQSCHRTYLAIQKYDCCNHQTKRGLFAFAYNGKSIGFTKFLQQYHTLMA